MKMIAVLLSFAIFAVSAEDFQLQFQENDNKYVETIKIDVANNTEEIQVPKHETRKALGILNDFAIGLSAYKFHEEKVCYLSPVDKEMPAPMQFKESLELSGSKFPASRYSVVTTKSFPLRHMTRSEVGTKIAEFCEGFALVLTIDFKKDNVDEDIARLLRGKSQRRKRRRVAPTLLVTETRNACDKKSYDELNCCPVTYNLHCKWRTTHCYYWIKCFMNKNAKGHSCTNKHMLKSTPLCCNYTCPRNASGSKICDNYRPNSK